MTGGPAMTNKRDINPLDELPKWMQVVVYIVGGVILIGSGLFVIFIIIAIAAAMDTRKI